MNHGHSHHLQEMLSKTTQIVSKPKSALPIAAKQPARILRQTVQRASIATVICAYFLMIVVVLWLVFALRDRVTTTSQSSSLRFERTCVVLTRHKVKPTTPAIDSVRGGSMEPFAFGSLAFDLEHEEVTWNISDSLAVEPHEIAIRGPLDSEDRKHNAPVHIMLGVQRDSKFRLSGSATSNREKIAQLKANPSKYYLSVHEKLVDGSVRELARDTLDKPCKDGVQ